MPSDKHEEKIEKWKSKINSADKSVTDYSRKTGISENKYFESYKKDELVREGESLKDNKKTTREQKKEIEEKIKSLNL